MSFSITLTDILHGLHEVGYTDNIYKHCGKLFCHGKELINPQTWIHDYWFDDFTDERITVYCCIAGDIKGAFIQGRGE